ncbi:MAG TPA: 2'-5' RNA ligase family protein [Candidatus Saccharimonadales bacterium]|nr:2'-5' RNA ligase family protein [Candidatus Saccharimonadales bacterium]
MAYLVIAYPELQQADFDWIQNYRKANDPRYFSVVEPHITLVFAISDIDKDSFVSEVKQKLVGTEAFDLEIKVATINQNDDGSYYHEFLVPDTGYSNIVKLHDKLYSGLFAPHLRFDIDFIPHIGIGNSDKAQTSKKRVDDLNKQELAIKGRIGSIDVIEYADGKVSTVEKIRLPH